MTIFKYAILMAGLGALLIFQPAAGLAGTDDSPQAQYRMGVKFATGNKVARDMSKAAKWFTRAAALGHVPAQYRLGLLYARGAGVPQDFTRAREWLRKAAMGGYPKAQYYLGQMYVRGDGVKPDYIEACKWFWLATSLGDEYARKRLRAMTMRISRNQFAEAKRRAKQLWKTMPHTYKVKGKMTMH